MAIQVRRTYVAYLSQTSDLPNAQWKCLLNLNGFNGDQRMRGLTNQYPVEKLELGRINWATRRNQLTQTIMTQESHHSGLRPLLRTQDSPTTSIIVMMIPYAMKLNGSIGRFDSRNTLSLIKDGNDYFRRAMNAEHNQSPWVIDVDKNVAYPNMIDDLISR